MELFPCIQDCLLPHRRPGAPITPRLLTRVKTEHPRLRLVALREAECFPGRRSSRPCGANAFWHADAIDALQVESASASGGECWRNGLGRLPSISIAPTPPCVPIQGWGLRRIHAMVPCLERSGALRWPDTFKRSRVSPSMVLSWFLGKGRVVEGGIFVSQGPVRTHSRICRDFRPRSVLPPDITADRLSKRISRCWTSVLI